MPIQNDSIDQKSLIIQAMTKISQVKVANTAAKGLNKWLTNDNY